VRIWLNLPDSAVRQLADDGQDLSKAALEALAIDAYRTNESPHTSSASCWACRPATSSMDS
jgi:hypothetical protein